MIPITLHRRNALQWLQFGLMELFRVLRALFLRSGNRELAVTRYVEQNAELGNPRSVLDTMDEFALEHRFLMNVGEEKGEVLVSALQGDGPLRCLELGAYCGYSAVLVGQEIASRGGTLKSLEVSSKNAAMARRVVAHAGLSSCVDIRVGPASEQIPMLDGTFDVVFIDHWKDDYLPDLQRLEMLGLLAPGARIVADNVGIFESTLEDYLTYVRTAEHMQSTHYATRMEYSETIEDGVEVSIWSPPARLELA